MRTLIPSAQLRTLVKRMLDTGHVSLDGRCGDFSGFYPIHAVTCQGLRGMYDYLTEGLPPEHRCDKLRLAETGQLALGTDQMTPLQLAAIRGLPYIFQHIMTKELTKILWIWGPVTQYQISLEGIDSAGHNASGMQRRPSRALARACDQLCDCRRAPPRSNAPLVSSLSPHAPLSPPSPISLSPPNLSQT